MSAKIKRELELKVLGGDSASEYAATLLGQGFEVLRKLRLANTETLSAAIDSRSARSQWLRHRLPYGATLEIALDPQLKLERLSTTYGKQTYLVAGRIRLRSGAAVLKTHGELPRELAARVKGNAEVLIGMVSAVERARRQILTLIEEGSRWLP